MRSTDESGLHVEKSFEIYVNDINEPPEKIYFQLLVEMTDETALNTVVGLFFVDDPDFELARRLEEQTTFELVPGDGNNDNEHFEIEGNALIYVLRLDSDRLQNIVLNVRTADGSGLEYEELLTVDGTYVPDAPSDIILNNTALQEN